MFCRPDGCKKSLTVSAALRSPIPRSRAAELPTGPLRPDNWAAVIGALLPENAIISDEANTSGLLLPDATAASPPHDVLTLTGGAIGQGLPVAIGAAIAAPHRPVVALQADGSALYTISALWTMAREQLDITVVILNNRAYAILQLELMRVGASAAGPKAQSLLDLSNPGIDFVAIAEGFGVPAKRATTAEELATQFWAAVREPGPHLIDAVMPAPAFGECGQIDTRRHDIATTVFCRRAPIASSHLPTSFHLSTAVEVFGRCCRPVSQDIGCWCAQPNPSSARVRCAWPPTTASRPQPRRTRSSFRATTSRTPP